MVDEPGYEYAGEDVNRRDLLSVPVVPPDYPRPPGALDEADFLARCTQCMDCAVACPHAAIGLLGDGTPALDPNKNPCHLCEDLPCIAACERGALVPVPMEGIFYGLAAVNPRTCIPFLGPECGACRVACPIRAIRMDGVRPVVDLDVCNGCGLCREACIVYDKAIRIDW